MFLADAVVEHYVKQLRRAGLFVGVVLTIAGVTLTAMYLYNLNRQIAALKAANASAQANQRAAETWLSGNKALTIERKESDDVTEQVLASNPDWADQPVPDDVASLLRNRERTEP